VGHIGMALNYVDVGVLHFAKVRAFTERHNYYRNVPEYRQSPSAFKSAMNELILDLREFDL